MLVLYHTAYKMMGTHQIDTTGCASQFCIDFHSQVGVILGLVLEHMINVHALRNNTVSTISRLLNTVIHVRVLGGEDEKHDLRTELICISYRGEELLHSLASIRDVLMDYRSRVVDLAAMAAIDFDEVPDKSLNSLQRRPVQRIRKASNMKGSKTYGRGPLMMATPHDFNGA